MLGMDMMLKNMLGIDVEELRPQVEALMREAPKIMGDVNARILNIERAIAIQGQNQVVIYKLLQTIAAKMEVDQSIAAIAHE